MHAAQLHSLLDNVFHAGVLCAMNLLHPEVSVAKWIYAETSSRLPTYLTFDCREAV